MLQCETLQEEALRAALAPTPTAITVNEAERAAALELLCSPDLIERIASLNYDSLGRRADAWLGGAAASNEYDGISRLWRLTNNLANTADDLTIDV